MSFFEELKRRNVIRVAIAYVVTAWLVAQVLELLFDSFGTPDWVMKTILVLMAVGLVFTLVFAWAFELTPDGIKRESEVDRAASIRSDTGKKLDRTIIIVLVLAVGYFAWEPRFSEEGEKGSGLITSESGAPTNDSTGVIEPDPFSAAGAERLEKSVAVLPFVNISPDPEQEYFSDGISEEILNVLTRIPNLKVAARTSSFQFKGQNLDISEIARQLKVNHVLEGSVRKAGNKLRITAQLIKADSGYHLWSDTYDRELKDVFAIQDEIANAIAGELRTHLSGQALEASTRVNMEAYQLYLKGRGLVATRREAELLEGADLLQSALEIAPGYVPAMATLAKARMVLPWFSNAIPAGEARAQARHWADKALQAEPDNAEALAAMAIVYNEVDLRPAKALELLQRAVKSSPGSVAAHNFLGDVYTRVGDFDRALQHEARAAELDPLGPVHLTDLANVYRMKGDYQRVIELAHRALEFDPGFQNAHLHMVDAHYLLSDLPGLEEAVNAARTKGNMPKYQLDAMRIQLLAGRGDLTGARALLGSRIDLARADSLSAALVAHDAIILGDMDAAGELLLKALHDYDGTWVFPLWVRLPEQAPDSPSWQEFWRQPGPARFAELRHQYRMPLPRRGFVSGATDPP